MADDPKVPLEAFEQKFISNLCEATGLDVKVMGQEKLAEMEGSGRSVWVNPRMIEAYADAQRKAEEQNNRDLDGPWVGCSCGRIHYRDPATGEIDTGWY